MGAFESQLIKLLFKTQSERTTVHAMRTSSDAHAQMISQFDFN
jgi:hypothetical protein